MKSMLDQEENNLLKNRLSNYSEMPDEGSWDVIQVGVVLQQRAPLLTRVLKSATLSLTILSLIIIYGSDSLLEKKIYSESKAISKTSTPSQNNLSLAMLQAGSGINEKNLLLSKTIDNKDCGITPEVKDQYASTTKGIVVDEKIANKTNAAYAKAGREQLRKLIAVSNTNQVTDKSDKVRSDLFPSMPDQASGNTAKNDRIAQAEGGSNSGINESSKATLRTNDIKASHNLSNDQPAISTDSTSASVMYVNSFHNGAEGSSRVNNNLSLLKDSIPKITVEDKEKITLKDKADKKQEKKDKKHLSNFYALVMPTLGYQRIDPNKDDNILIAGIKKVSAFSPKRLGVRAELGWERKISDRVSFYTGILYFQRKQTITYSYFDSTNLKVTSINQSTYELSPQLSEKTFEYEVRNVGALLGLNYKIAANRFVHKVGLGAELHKSLLKAPDVAAGSSFTNTMYLFGHVYYQASYSLSKHVDFMVQPTINYSVYIHERINAPFYVKPYGLGLNIGVRYKL